MASRLGVTIAETWSSRVIAKPQKTAKVLQEGVPSLPSLCWVSALIRERYLRR